MSDAGLLRAALGATGYSTRRLALRVLAIDDGTARRILRGEGALNGTARLLCRALVQRPTLARTLERIGVADNE